MGSPRSDRGPDRHLSPYNVVKCASNNLRAGLRVFTPFPGAPLRLRVRKEYNFLWINKFAVELTVNMQRAVSECIKMGFAIAKATSEVGANSSHLYAFRLVGR